jgi:ATP-dependent Clp protease ATP-binding subunit ClpC
MMPNNIKKILSGIYGVLLLEDLFPHKIRRLVFHMFGSASLILLLVVIFGQESLDKGIKGGLFISLSITLFLFTLECYFYSIVVKSRGGFYVSFDVGEVLFYAEDEDLTKSLLFSEIGDEGMQRLGFSEEEIKDFLTERDSVHFGSIMNSIVEHISYGDYFKLIYNNDKAFADFLFAKGIQEKEFVGAMSWMITKNRRRVEKERFWSSENLGKIPGFGKNWSYGETYTLEKYGEDLTESVRSFDSSYQKSKENAVSRIESVLTRGRGANVVVTSEDESSRLDVVTMLAQKINQKAISSALQHKRVYLLNSNSIIEATHDKISFEREFTILLNETIHAENVIIVIPFLSSFIKNSTTIGGDVMSILLPYLQSPFIHIIALDSKKDYLEFLSSKSSIAENFEMVQTDNGDDSSLVSMLIDESEQIESMSQAIISYPAILGVVAAADRYFDPALKAEKCKEILVESVGTAFGKGRKLVLKEDILSQVEKTTGIPTSAPEGEEKTMLQNLATLLHKRIVGQDEAVKVVAEALKRSRAGVRNPDKPIGSFLFLGPTGVGKTETTKALADIVFGKEDVISRFDMGEYRDGDALERLIGSFGTGKSGTLSMTLRDKPYGVLLLDEFEKTTSDIINLFLRVFDEGVFTDADGRKINVKNNVIIATSNAGSEMIWDIVRSGKNLLESKDKIINAIIDQGIFKPELLNRFDAVVLFHPLLTDDLRKIAVLMMQKFEKRMREKGVMVETTPAFIDYLVSKGNDPKFGARPMNRAIAEEVERFMADKIIDGDVKQGSKIVFDIGTDGKLLLR